MLALLMSPAYDVVSLLEGVVMAPITPVVEMEGKVVGRWTIVARDESRHGDQAYWICQCACGSKKSVNGSSLRRGISTSCGCHRNEATSKAKSIHGRHGSPEWRVWVGMRNRCSNPKASGYYKYGARGIRVCPRWSEFKNFLADMGDRPAGASIDRIDNDGDYCPENCRWATASEQARNRRTTRMFTHDGKTMCIKDWCDHLGLNQKTVRTRLSAGGKTIPQALGLEA